MKACIRCGIFRINEFMELEKHFFIGYLLFLFLTVIPVILTADDRKYIDIKAVKFQKEIAPEDIYVQPPMEAISEPMFAEEEVEPIKEDEQIFIGKRTQKRTEEDRVRRLYRKFIRKHRKELPAIYETPTEIELAAGVADTEEGKAMHEKYEQARYGIPVKNR